METTPLKIRNDGWLRVSGAANADVHQNDCTLNFRIALSYNAIDQELRRLLRLH
jgi:hypothetical protein